MKFLILVVIVLISVFLLSNLFWSEYKAGQCVKDKDDGYTWHVNRFTFGKYYASGWQGNAWGNEVNLEKDILERSDINGVPIYHRVECPLFNPNSK